MSLTLLPSLPSESEFRVAQNVLPWEEAAEARLRRDDLPRISSLTVILCARNDAHTIGATVDFTARLLPKVADDFELVVVDDGSDDATGEVLHARQARYPFLRVVTHASTRGVGAALRSGFSVATKGHVFYTDGDGQYDPTELIALIPALEGHGMASGYRLYRGDGFLRHVVGRTYHYAARALFGLPLRDTDCAFRLIRRDVLTGLRLTADGGAIGCELVWQMKNSKMHLAEVGIRHYPRVFGATPLVQPASLAKSLQALVTLWARLVLGPFGGRILRALRLRK